MKIKRLFAVFFFVLFLTSCSSSEAEIESLRSVVASQAAEINKQRSVIESLQASVNNTRISDSFIEDATAASTCDYILNKSTRKFHKPGCASVKLMDFKNMIFFDGTREEAVENGYEPCGRCHP